MPVRHEMIYLPCSMLPRTFLKCYNLKMQQEVSSYHKRYLLCSLQWYSNIKRRYTMSNYTTIEERLELEVMLAKGFSFAEIAKHLSKSCSTIFREVRRYAIMEKTGYSSVAFNCCQHRMTCEKTKVCGSS